MSQTILVADDSQTIRKVVRLALKVAPFEVVSAESGQRALQKAQQGSALVVLDYHFSDAKGAEVARQIPANVPILMLAGDRHDFDEQRAREAGVNRIIPKPFSTDTLLDAIVATTGVSKKALVKRQKDAPISRTPLTGKGAGGPSADAPTTGGPGGMGGMEAQASSGGGGGGRGGGARMPTPDEGGDSGGASQPRMRTPDGDQDGSSSGSSPRRADSRGQQSASSGSRRRSGGEQAQSGGSRRQSGSEGS
ncbi:MAG: PleD family two-component system response regulator, partial [Bradymonadaceae bacterium]